MRHALMRAAFVLAALAGALAVASPALAVTRYVDDDRRQCPQATFTKIQPAIDASSRIDAVRVCAGTYPEQLTLPARAPGLFVDSFPASAAHVVPPPAGLVARFDPEGEGHLNLVQVLGDQQRFNGFSLSGILRPSHLYDACLATEAIEVEGAAAVVDGVTIADTENVECTHGGGFPHFETLDGVLLSGRGAIVQGSAIRGTATGVDVRSSDGAIVQNNTIVGLGAGPRIAAYPGIAAGYLGSPATHVSIRSNDVSHSGFGIFLYTADGLVKGNTVHEAGTGIWIVGDSHAEINANVLRHNLDDGLRVASSSQSGVSGIIRANDAHYNGHDGIAILGCDCTALTPSFVVDHNLTGANGRYDCFDSQPANDVWSANIGFTDSPSTLCSPH